LADREMTVKTMIKISQGLDRLARPAADS